MRRKGGLKEIRTIQHPASYAKAPQNKLPALLLDQVPPLRVGYTLKSSVTTAHVCILPTLQRDGTKNAGRCVDRISFNTSCTSRHFDERVLEEWKVRINPATDLRYAGDESIYIFV